MLRDSQTRRKHNLKELSRYESTEYLEDAVIREEIAMMVRREVDKLPPQARKVLRLAMKDYSNTEIAQQLDLSVNTVKSHKLSAYGLLRHNLKELKMLLGLLWLS